GETVRHGRVASGLAELERWLADQVRQGLAGAAEDDWEGLAKRLVDAQAPGAAGTVSRLTRVRSEEGWPGRLLEEYALLNLLAVAYRRRAGLPAALARTVLIRAGFPVTREEVLARPAVRDHWDVLGGRDEVQDRLTARKVWLRGRRTQRPALILSFAPQGQPLDSSLVTGTTIEADLTYYPGAAPLRALVAARHGTVPPPPGRGPSGARGSSGSCGPPGVSPEEALDEVASALADDPWTESWPLVLSGVVPERTGLGGLPLHVRARDPWRLIAVSGGRPLTVAVEWTPQGLRPLTTWDDDGRAVIL
ncbi:SWIM zinc finger family protein, partial [Nonomuraea sp. KC401]|uniref:SWIM zinc finger family protein n=1 Tax=Nonomuraea sp. KC401 TaxID=1848324 RepID=UPI0010FD692E